MARKEKKTTGIPTREPVATDLPLNEVTKRNNKRDMSQVERGPLTEVELLNIVMSDYNNSKTYQSRELSRIYSWRKQYKGAPYGNEREGHTKVVSKDIRKFSEWSINTTLDAFVSTPDIVKCNALHPSSVEQAKIAEMVLNTQFCSQFNRFDFLSKALRVLDIDGTLVVKTGWDYVEEEREVIEEEKVPAFNEETGMPQIDPYTQEQLINVVPKKVTKMVPVVNQPTAMVCRNDDIFIDPTALGDIKNCNFIIHRFATNMSALRLEGKYSNLDQLENVIAGSAIGDAEYVRDENFGFSDDPRRRVIVYEYWGNIDVNGDGITEPVVVTWSHDILLQAIENPMPDKKHPFIIVPFMPYPFKFYGESNVENLDYIQKLKTAILRGMTDSLARANSGQIGMRKGALDELNRRKLLKGENFEFNGTPQDIYTTQFNAIPGSTFSLLELLNQEAEGLTGLSAVGARQYQQGLKGHTTGASQLLDAGNIRKLQIIRNVSENLIKPLLRKWLTYDYYLLGEEYYIRTTDSNFIMIHPDDLRGEIDIGLTISTNEDNQIKAQELAFLLQTLGPSGDPYTNKRLMVEIARLHKMYDLADSIENYEPQPDPYEQAIKELTIQKLEAEIKELGASVQRVSTDAELKQAKAATEYAKSRNIGGKSDLDALKYYNDRNNISHQRELEKLDRKAKLEQELQKTKNSANLMKDILNLDTIDNRKLDTNKQNVGMPFFDVGSEKDYRKQGGQK